MSEFIGWLAIGCMVLLLVQYGFAAVVWFLDFVYDVLDAFGGDE